MWYEVEMPFDKWSRLMKSSVCSHGWCAFDVSENEKWHHHLISIVNSKVLASFNIYHHGVYELAHILPNNLRINI